MYNTLGKFTIPPCYLTYYFPGRHLMFSLFALERQTNMSKEFCCTFKRVCLHLNCDSFMYFFSIEVLHAIMFSYIILCPHPLFIISLSIHLPILPHLNYLIFFLQLNLAYFQPFFICSLLPVTVSRTFFKVCV